MIARVSTDIEMRATSSLRPFERNTRTHSDEQVRLIADAISEFGWTNPILIDEASEIIAGHGRLLAAKLLGHEQVPCLLLAGLTELQKRAYRIADNKIALNSGWNITMLEEELAALQDAEFNLGVVGFSEAELAHLLSTEEQERNQQTEWRGMPEFNQEDQTAFRQILVSFKDQEAVEEFGRRIDQDITDRTRYLWFPAAVKETYMDKRYAADGSQ